MDFLLNKRINIIGEAAGQNNIANNDSADETTSHSHHFLFGLDDSGIATSNDVHSLEFDDHIPVTPPPTIIVEQHLDHHHVVDVVLKQHPAANRGIIALEKSKATSSIPSLSINSHATSSLNVHYYPEGNWGFVIAGIAVLVQVLTHGVQLSFGIFLLAAKGFFKSDQLLTLGNLLEVLVVCNDNRTHARATTHKLAIH